MTQVVVSWLLFAAGLAVLLTAVGAAQCFVRRRRPYARVLGGPYRTVAVALGSTGRVGGEWLVAAGTALLASAVTPALVAALATLRWEGIGVSLLPAIALGASRFVAATMAMRTNDLSASRTVATAALLLDVPLGAFALVHVSLCAAHERDPVSLAAVALAYASVDGLQALFVVCSKARR